MLIHEGGKEIGDEIDTAELVDDIDESANAADEDQCSPGDTLDGFLFIGCAEKDQDGGRDESEQSGVKLEADAENDHDDDRADGQQLISVELRNIGKLHGVVSFDLVALVHYVNNAGEDKAGKQGGEEQVQAKAAVAKRLGQPMEKFPACIQETGNVSAASIPMVLDKINRAGQLTRGDKLVFAGFGAGLTWGASVLTW